MIYTIFELMTIVHLAACGTFSVADKVEILEEHNNLRFDIANGIFAARNVQMPSATNMMRMKWDDGLESSAQMVADRCQFEHSRIQGIGENLWMVWGSQKQNITGRGREASNSWANEFQTYGWPDIRLTTSVFNNGIGHATQMAWAETEFVGCGASLCDGDRKVIVVCHYRKQGNYLNRNVYEPGPVCSDCPPGSVCQSGLCSQGKI